MLTQVYQQISCDIIYGNIYDQYESRDQYVSLAQFIFPYFGVKTLRKTTEPLPCKYYL
jgi:hypothetical protein